jgi:hypothetical protein
VADDPPLSLPPEADDFSDAFSDSPAEVPPEASLSPDELSLDSPPSSVLEDDPVPVGPVVPAAVAVVDVEVVSVASFSAELSLGGVISGVLLGVASDTLVPPHALTPSEATSIKALAASAIRRGRCGARLTRRVDPSGERRLGNR